MLLHPFFYKRKYNVSFEIVSWKSIDRPHYLFGSLMARHGMASLRIIINNKQYIVLPIRNDAQEKVYSLSNDEQTYQLGENNIGCFCSCPDWQHREPPGGCKHIKALKAFWLISPDINQSEVQRC